MKNAKARLDECIRLESKIIHNLKIYYKLNFLLNMYKKAYSNTEKKANGAKEEKGRRCWRSFFLRSQNLKTSTYMNERNKTVISNCRF